MSSGIYGYDLFDVLAAIRVKTGITVKSSSDVGAEDWLLIRGLPRDSSRNVLVLVDGMPLNDALSESNEFEHLPPIDFIEKIIVYKPPLPARFGGYTAAVEIFTKGGSEDSSAEISGALGEYKSGFLSLGTEGPFQKFSYRLSLDYLKTDNLTGVRRTPPADHIVYGDRSYWKIRSALKLMYDVTPASQLSLYSQYLESEKFFSDEIFRGDRERRKRRLLNFNLNYMWKPWEESDLSLTLFRIDESYQLNLMMHPGVRDQDRFKQGVRFNWAFALPGKQSLSLGGHMTDLHTEERLGTPLSLTDAAFYSLYVEDTIQAWENLHLTLGLRLDDHSEAKSHWKPSFSAVYRPFGSTTLYGLWGKSVRWPALSELDARNPQVGLEGEDLETSELGITQEIGSRVSTRLSVFLLKLKKESKFFMDFTQFPPSFFQRNEPGGVDSLGVEAEVNISIDRNLRGFINYTYNRVEEKPEGNVIDFAGPQSLGNIGLIYAGKKGHLTLIGRYGGKAKGVQRMMGSPTELSEWFALDLAGKIKISKDFSFLLRAANILNTQFETFDGRPMFGRMVVSGITINF